MEIGYIHLVFQSLLAHSIYFKISTFAYVHSGTCCISLLCCSEEEQAWPRAYGGHVEPNGVFYAQVVSQESVSVCHSLGRPRCCTRKKKCMMLYLLLGCVLYMATYSTHC